MIDPIARLQFSAALALMCAAAVLLIASVLLVMNQRSIERIKGFARQFEEVRAEVDKAHQMTLEYQKATLDYQKRLDDAYGMLMVIAHSEIDASHKVRMAQEFLKAAGVSGWVHAQVVDPAQPPPVH